MNLKKLMCNLIIGVEYTPILSILDQCYDLYNVTVTVEWTQQVQAVGIMYYDVRVSPLAPILINNGSASCRLMILYNTEYNLSVVAVTPCGNAITSLTLNYGKAKLVYNYAILLWPVIIAISHSHVMWILLLILYS